MKIIGISGKSGSGKTTLIKMIRNHFSENNVCILSLDNYYKNRENQIKDEKGYYNFDLMSSFDWKKLVRDVKHLASGQDLHQKQYSFNNEDNDIYVVLRSAKLLIIEGILALAQPEIWSLLDYSIIIEANNDICRKRRLARDMSERNYDEEEILHRFDNHVLPSYESIIEPLKASVDLVLINEESLDIAKKILMGKVESFLK